MEDDIRSDADARGCLDSSQCIGAGTDDGEPGKPLPEPLPPGPAVPILGNPTPEGHFGSGIHTVAKTPHPYCGKKFTPTKSRRKQRWTTPKKVAEYMGVDPDTVRNWLRKLHLAGKVEHSKHYTDDRDRKTARGKWRVFEADLTTLLRAMRAKGPLGFGPGFWEGKA